MAHTVREYVLIYKSYYKERPQHVFYGHIHEAEGVTKIGKTEVYNLSVCGYKIIEL